MAQEQTMTMKRGSYRTKGIWVPASMYTVGGKLIFGVKPQVDDDNNDAQAKIKVTMTDADISNTNIAGDKRFLLQIQESDTVNIDCAEETEFVGDIKYIDANGKPHITDTFIFKLEGNVNMRDA